jgi:histidine ammonia-lyase
MTTEKPILYISGSSMTIDKLMEVGTGKYRLELTPEAWNQVKSSRQIVENILKEDKKVYGVNTGFGNFADVKISPEHVIELQENLIRSHAAGVGNPLSLEQTRRLLALRINVLAKGRNLHNKSETQRTFWQSNVLIIRIHSLLNL